MPYIYDTPTTTKQLSTRNYGQWGRTLDSSVFSGKQPERNPDPIDEGSSGERYFKITLNPYVKAAFNYRNISRLFVSAKGLDPDDTGAYFPAQVIYTTPKKGSPEQLLALQEQYDEGFEGGFGAIIKSLQEPAMAYGRAIAEIDWQREDDAVISPFIWSRDPERYIINPPELRPGIYQKQHIFGYSFPGNLKRMPDGKFFVVTFDSLFNNPYGQSVLRPIADMTETWNDIYDAWRMGCIKAGYGSWVGEYGIEIAGQLDSDIQARQSFSDELAKFANGTHSIVDARNNVRSEKLAFDSAAFLNFHTSYVQAVSVLMTGSSTALIDGKNGSYAKEESTTTRQKSDKEQTDALLIGAAFTYNFNRYWMHYNFPTVDAVPQLQLIRPELIMPTTPQGQDTQDEVEKESIDIRTDENNKKTEEKDIPIEKPAELQALEKGIAFKVRMNALKKEYAEFLELAEGDDEEAEGEEEKETLTVGSFPDTEPEPEIYGEDSVVEGAKAYLDDLPVKNYKDVAKSEQAGIFTIKRLRNFPDSVAIMTELLAAIADTFDQPTESEAWDAYVIKATAIFSRLGLALSSGFKTDFIPSFRQARQRAYQAGIDKLIEDSPETLTGIEIQTRDDIRVRPVHALWAGVVLAPGDARLDKLHCPMDFLCRCNWIPVFNNEKPLTPENKIPAIFPGESYRGYVA